jgi:hypothetical protein
MMLLVPQTLLLNVSKGATERSNNNKKAHSLSQKAKQQTRRANEQKSKPVSAWVTDGKC